MHLRFCLLVISLIAMPAAAVPGQSSDRRITIAVLDFASSGMGPLASQSLSANLRSLPALDVLDRDQAGTAAKGAGYSSSLNMSLPEARILGAAIGCEFYILGDAQTLRRSPSAGPVYFESYASIFLVSSRTGRLVMWQRPSFQAATLEAVERVLLAELSDSVTRSRILVAIRRAQADERQQRELAMDSRTPIIDEALDDEKSAATQGLRLPRPYRRLIPVYPESAARAEAEATVDVLVHLNAKGEVGHVEVARWAGFGLDEATIETVRGLHFFPAMRNGTPIPSRALLRYNFRKPAK